MIAARGLRGIHEWHSLIEHEGEARVVYQMKPRVCTASRSQATVSSNWLVLCLHTYVANHISISLFYGLSNLDSSLSS